MDSVLKEMIKIYRPAGIDWLDYRLSRNSPYTFHHIKEVRNGGKRIIDNGAILTLNGHKYLNYLDYEYFRIYRELNGLFLELNRTQRPPAEDYYDEVHKILRKVPLVKAKIK